MSETTTTGRLLLAGATITYGVLYVGPPRVVEVRVTETSEGTTYSVRAARREEANE